MTARRREMFTTPYARSSPMAAGERSRLSFSSMRAPVASARSTRRVRKTPTPRRMIGFCVRKTPKSRRCARRLPVIIRRRCHRTVRRAHVTSPSAHATATVPQRTTVPSDAHVINYERPVAKRGKTRWMSDAQRQRVTLIIARADHASAARNHGKTTKCAAKVTNSTQCHATVYAPRMPPAAQ